jgi:hypothetical protein
VKQDNSRDPNHNRGHDDHRPVARRQAVSHVQLGKRSRGDLRRHDQVEDADGELADWQERDDRDEPEIAGCPAVAAGIRHQAREGERRKAGEGAEVAEYRMPVDETRHSFAQRGRIVEIPFEPEPTSRDQVVPDMMATVVLWGCAPGLVGQLDRATRDDFFGLLRAPCQLLHRVAISIARGEVHSRRTGGILSEDSFNEADALENSGQSIDDSTQLVRCCRSRAGRRFALMLDPQHLVGRVTLRLERALACHARRRRRRLVAQPVQQFDDKRGESGHWP